MQSARTMVRLGSFLFLAWSTVSVSAPLRGAGPKIQSQELVVLLATGRSEPIPEDVVDRAEHGRQLPNELGIGAPTGARLVIPKQDRRIGPLDDPEGPSARLQRYIVLSYPSVINLETIRAALLRNPHVLAVEYNLQLHVSAVPNDPLFPATDSSGNPRSPDQYQWGSAALHLPQAWDFNKGHAYVGVVDIGLDTTHPDLRAFHQENGTTFYDGGNFRPQFAFDYGYPGESPNSVDEGQPELQSGSVQTPSFAGHGTHVSGIIAGNANNQAGVAGACWNCSLMMSKISTLYLITGGWSNGNVKQADVIAGMNGALRRGAQVLNMSLGYRPNDNPPAPDCQANPQNSFCLALQLSQDRDVVIAAASGNDHSSIVDFPASDSRTLAVGGIDSTGSFWNDCASTSFECGSNYNPDQIVSPAKQILSTFYRGLYYGGAGSTCPGFTDYGLCTGTSMASPYMAGSVGILRSVNPLLTKDNIKDLLRTHLDNPVGWNTQFGRGKPDISVAVKAALGTSGGTQIANRLTPLFSLYSSLAQDFFYTTVPQMASSAILDSESSYLSSGPLVRGYDNFPGVPGCQISPCADVKPAASVYIFTGDKAPYAGAPPLVPLYRLSYKPSDPSDPNRDTAYTTETNGILAFKSIGYELDGIEGYIYQRCTPEPSCIPPGAVRLYRLYNYSRDDYAIFPESELAQFQAAGYVSQSGLNDWIGYGYPNVDSDGDNLIDGFETLIGTNPNLADSDCDGVNDGVEVLGYPASDPLSSPGCVLPRDARILSQSVPTIMVAGQSYTVIMTVKNAGSLSWNPIGPQCNAYRLGSLNTNWNPTRADLSAALAPGQQVTLTFTVTAPSTPGTYNFQWRMVQECVTWFGDLSPNVAVTVRAAQPQDAQLLSQNVPSTMVAGQSYTVSMTWKNVGSLSWNPVGPQCNAYRLGTTNSNTWNSYGRVDLPGAVAPGQQVTLTFTVTAPTTPGTYNFQWRMVQECVAWFGDLSPNVAVTVRAAQPQDAQLLSQNVPSTMVAGQSYTVSVRVKNVGSQVWSPVGPVCGAYRLGSLNTNWNPTRADLSAALAPGQEVTLTFTVTAPSTHGTYNFQWRMVQECVAWLGDPGPNVSVIVN